MLRAQKLGTSSQGGRQCAQGRIVEGEVRQAFVYEIPDEIGLCPIAQSLGRIAIRALAEPDLVEAERAWIRHVHGDGIAARIEDGRRNLRAVDEPGEAFDLDGLEIVRIGSLPAAVIRSTR